jgi:hypothetical protein
LADNCSSDTYISVVMTSAGGAEDSWAGGVVVAAVVEVSAAVEDVSEVLEVAAVVDSAAELVSTGKTVDELTAAPPV